MAVHQASLFPISSSPAFPPGFRYCAEAITPEDECSLVDQIAELPFKEFQFHGFEGKRRVVSFGWRYDFSQHKALPADPVSEVLDDCLRDLISLFKDTDDVLDAGVGRVNEDAIRQSQLVKVYLLATVSKLRPLFRKSLICKLLKTKWSGRVDSNHRPPGPEPGALPG